LPAVVYIDLLDERATNVYTSPRTAEMLGYSAREWETDPDLWVKLLDAGDLERALAAQQRHVETGEPLDEVYRLTARDGRTVWVRDVAVVVRGDDGTPLYSQGFLLDITAQRESEIALEAAIERERSRAPGPSAPGPATDEPPTDQT
jgi:PAS domain S-box-containing protein